MSQAGRRLSQIPKVFNLNLFELHVVKSDFVVANAGRCVAGYQGIGHIAKRFMVQEYSAPVVGGHVRAHGRRAIEVQPGVVEGDAATQRGVVAVLRSLRP